MRLSVGELLNNGSQKAVLTNSALQMPPDHSGEIAEHRLWLTEVHRHLRPSRPHRVD